MIYPEAEKIRRAYSGFLQCQLGFKFIFLRRPSQSRNLWRFGILPSLVGFVLVVVQHTQTMFLMFFRADGLNHVKRSLNITCTRPGSVHTCAANVRVLLILSERQKRGAHDGSAARFGIEFLCVHEKQAEEIMARED